MANLSRLIKSLFQGHNPFEIEIIKSEFNRTLLMLGSLGLMLSAALINFAIWEETRFSVIGGIRSFLSIISWIFAMLVFEGIVLWRISWFKKRNLRLPQLFRYAYSIIEISFPTFLMFYQVLIMGNTLFLDSPLFVFYFLIIFLSCLHIDYRLSFIIGLVGAVEYAAIIFLAYSDDSGQHLNIELPAAAYYVRCVMIIIMGIAAAFIANQVHKRISSFLSLLKSQQELERSFGQQVSEEITKVLKEQGDDAREFHATVMVLDIRNFSAFADTHTPAEILKFQNKIFAPIIEIINRHRGIVNQIMGDGLMATFGAPLRFHDHSQQAFKAAKDILRMVNASNRSHSLSGVRIGIGIHSGEVITGNIGNNNRKQYSFSGSAVIIAFRVEQLNKEYGSALLITSPVKETIDPDIPLQYLGKKALKGLNAEVDIYRGE